MPTDTTVSDTRGRPWLTPTAATRDAEILDTIDWFDAEGIDQRVHDLIERNRDIHERECINLNPASNVMNPRAEAVLAQGLSSRASLGHPGEKYEMGLEAIEQIEVIAAQLARRLFQCDHAEFRVPSGAIANLYAFMATCRPGDTIIVPSADIGGHVTHHDAGAAGLFGLRIIECPSDPATFSVDLDALSELARRERPRLITIGTSLNLAPHPIGAIREIADRVNADVLFDAAHACGMIAGGVWPNPLDVGADLMTMSTYKSLGGPAGGLVLTRRADLAERIDAIAYPGLTANFDVAKTAALAITLLDWLTVGAEYAAAMATNAATLADALIAAEVPVHITGSGATHSHQLAVDARRWGGGHATAQRLRDANLLASAIGLPSGGDGLRLGTPEVTRLGMGADEMGELAGLIADALAGDPSGVAERTSALRQRFTTIGFTHA